MVEGGAEDANGLGATGQVTGQVDDVNTQVDQRTAAGISLITEPAAGAAVTAQIAGLGVVDVAQQACILQVQNVLASSPKRRTKPICSNLPVSLAASIIS